MTSVETDGTLKMGETRTYLLGSINMQLKNRDAGLANTIRAPDLDLLLLVTVWSVRIIRVLILLSRRKRQHVED